MSQAEPARAVADDFVLYLEGPGDRAILDGWCRRLLPAFARRLSSAVVLLGGKQPRRALEHFRSIGGTAAGHRGLCVLDRDHDGPVPDETGGESGIEFFTWQRRHIESYLLVAPAIERAHRLEGAKGSVERALREHLPDGDSEDAFRLLDAKRLLAPRGPLARTLGRPLSLSKVARATRAAELHDDVHACFERVKVGLGVVETVVVR